MSLAVLHVIPTLDHASGGPSTALAGLAAAQRRCGAAVSVLVGRERAGDRALIEQLRSAEVAVSALAPASGDGAAGGRAGVRDAVEACAVCHIHAVWEGLLHRAAVACRAAGRPHLFRPCGMLDPWCLGQRRFRKRLYLALRLHGDLDRCSALHFTTDTERELAGPLGLRAPSIVEANGVALEEFEHLPAPGSFRASHPALGAKPIVLFMGRLHRKKGLDLLVPAFARLVRGEAMLAIAGPDEGGYRARVEALVARHRLGPRVVFTGMLRGPERLAALADADLFVLPSYQENFGVAVVEALAAGTPAIVSDQVNLHPLITAAGAGAAVPLRIEALAAEIERWLDDPPRRAEAAARGRALVRERFDWNLIAARWLDRYGALASGALPADARTGPRYDARK